MNAGKSTALLQVAYNYEEQGQQVKLYTAAIDDRYGVGVITSRLGPQRQVDVFDAESEQVSIGGNESYRQACGRCFYAG